MALVVTVLIASQPTASAVAGDVSAEPALRTVELLVRDSAPSDAEIAAAPSRELLGLFVRCLPMPGGLTYCLHLGWPADGTMDPATLGSILDQAAAAQSGGDVSFLHEIQNVAAKSGTERLAAELDEAREAYAAAPSVATDRDGARAIMGSEAAQSGVGPQLLPPPTCDEEPCPPDAKSIMTWATHGREQEETYYCGPASTQMAALWKGVSQSQDWWWPYVKVSGKQESSIYNIKNALNAHGGYGSSDPYRIVVFETGQAGLYLSTVVYKIWEDANPLISHVQLLKTYFSYLRYNASGHYQVIRGYDRYGDDGLDPRIKIFEPWDERDWYASGYHTSGPRDIHYLDMYDATMANYNQLGA